MHNSKRKNAAKAMVLTNLGRNLPEQPTEAEIIAVGKNSAQNLI